MPSVFLLFGSNLGNRVTNVRQSLLSLVEEGLELLQVSHFYETEAWGEENQPIFLNVCAKFKTSLSPKEVLQLTQEVEVNVGRERNEKWKERVIDIDILFYGKQMYEDEQLAIPHPFLINRNFALQPLKEIAKKKKHPKYGLTVAELTKLSTDEKKVLRLKYKPKVEG